MKREIKLPDFPFSDAGKCLTLPYCSLSASKGTTALPFLIIRVLLTPPPTATRLLLFLDQDLEYHLAACWARMIVGLQWWTSASGRDVTGKLEMGNSTCNLILPLSQACDYSESSCLLFFHHESVHCSDVMQCCKLFLARKGNVWAVCLEFSSNVETILKIKLLAWLGPFWRYIWE